MNIVKVLSRYFIICYLVAICANTQAIKGQDTAVASNVVYYQCYSG